jgi:hypothetical protein
MKKKREETWSLTLKGLIGSAPGIDDFQVEYIWNAIELYGFRHKKNAVYLADGGVFVNVEKGK